jgi:hypothetical protein
MPKAQVVKTKTGDPIQVCMPVTFERDMSIQSEKVFDDPDTAMVITSITIEGKIEGHSSPLVINVSGDDCTVTIDFAAPPSDAIPSAKEE